MISGFLLIICICVCLLYRFVGMSVEPAEARKGHRICTAKGSYELHSGSAGNYALHKRIMDF